ncbi:hypothetical protein [Psychrobacter sp. I-STPA6b]|uniref:hypothetical protein n=1 Tax=Psychrobacter sp. I-STPA6b TaxID=2585718 RepID=UPI001D0CAFE5|nr:hypothetical protein [Psychrobacter sp. I-STPA6b]
MKIIGNSEISFEVANNFTEEKLLCLRMIIKGNVIGTLQSPTYLPSFIGALNSILVDDCYFNAHIDTTNYRNFFLVDGKVTNNYRLTLEETFDDYEKRVIRNDNFIFFYFNLHDDYFFDYDIFLKNIFEFVSIGNYQDALLKFNNYIELNGLVKNLEYTSQ